MSKYARNSGYVLNKNFILFLLFYTANLPQNILEEDVAEAQIALSPNSGAQSQSTGTWVEGDESNCTHSNDKCSPNSDSLMGMENSSTCEPQGQNEENAESSKMVEKEVDLQVKQQTYVLSSAVENATCVENNSDKSQQEPVDESG